MLQQVALHFRAIVSIVARAHNGAASPGEKGSPQEQMDSETGDEISHVLFLFSLLHNVVQVTTSG